MVVKLTPLFHTNYDISNSLYYDIIISVLQIVGNICKEELEIAGFRLENNTRCRNQVTSHAVTWLRHDWIIKKSFLRTLAFFKWVLLSNTHIKSYKVRSLAE